MSRVKKKIFSVIGLLAVTIMTAIAAIIPTVTTHAVGSNVIVGVQVQGVNFSAMFSTPTTGEELVDATGTASLNYANTTDLIVEMIDPAGVTTTVYSGFSGPPNGSITFPYNFTSGYGDYTFKTSGLDLSSNPQTGQTITVSYRSAFFNINPNPGPNNDPSINVKFGPGVCGISFQIYSTDPGKDPTEGLLNPPYSLVGTPDFTSIPGYITGAITITLPLSQYNIPTGNYRIVMSTYDCSVTNNPLETDLEASFGVNSDGSFSFLGDGNTLPEVPNTGVIKIGGLTITHSDLIVTSVIVFFVVVTLYFFLRSRRRIKV